MRRVRYHAHGGPEVLAIEEAAIPEPGPGQVLIRTEVIGVNYVDVQLRRETSPDSIWFRSLPGTLTGDVVGTIVSAGADVDPALAGTRVAALLEDACADYVVADADWLASVPAGLEAGAASMLPTVGAVRSARCVLCVSALERPSWLRRARARSGISPCSWPSGRAPGPSSPPPGHRPSSTS
jgi:NADPH:quinone reductase-like Zn-dependent oxidoreductase